MNDDTNPGVGDTEPVSADTEVAEPELDTEGQSEEALEGQSEEELEEIERDGKKAKVPAWLKPELMMQADYTKKTQEVAETRKAYEAKETALAQRQQAFQAEAQEYAQLIALDTAIKQYEEQIGALRQQGHHDAAQKHWMDLMEMRNAAGRLSYGLQQKQQARSAEAEREHANRVRDRDTALTTKIPGYSPALLSKIQDFATSVGYTREEAQSLIDPRYVETLNEQRLWREHQAKAKQAAAKAKQQDEPVAQPTPTVASRKPPERLTADLAKRNPEKWIEMRNAQVAAKRKAGGR